MMGKRREPMPGRKESRGSLPAIIRRKKRTRRPLPTVIKRKERTTTCHDGKERDNNYLP
jgi:hypothetical protein